MMAENNILFYEPSESDNCETTPTGATASSATPTGGAVTVIGDSISTDMYSGGEIEAKLPGVENISWFGRGFTNAGNDGAPDGQRTGQQVIEQSELRNYVVLALGTNGMAAEALQPAVDAVLAKDEVAKIVLMTVYSTSTHREEDIVAFNNKVREIAGENAGRMAVMDWNSVAAGLSDDMWENPTKKLHPIGAGQVQFADVMYQALRGIWSGGGQGSGNADIMRAKNADRFFFNGEPSELTAAWSNGSADSMRRLLDNYGELAVALGNKYNVPYIAILVQMRYEDSTAKCGRNNFWGNWCSPSWARAGGADEHMIASGQTPPATLGEGFDLYGQTLTNGHHDQAIGIQDPIEYLEKIGPTWVQGNENGPGYGSIDGMRASVRALTSYINEIGWNGGFSGFSGNSYTANCNTPVSDGLVPGGMNLAQAQSFMKIYKDLALKYENSADRGTVTINDFGDPIQLFFTSICPGGRLANCSSFVEYFVQRYTTGEPAFPDGKDMARALINNNSGFEDGGTVPKAYAVFSIGGATADSFGHTGVVLGIDEARNKIIIGEAGCMSTSTRQDAIDFINAKEYDLDRYRNGSYTYAYTDKIMKASAMAPSDLPGLEFTSSEQYAAMPYGPYEGRDFPAYLQFGNAGIQGTWANRTWGTYGGVGNDSSFDGSGCGPTSLSMIVAFLTDTEFTPDNMIDILNEMAKNGVITHDYGGMTKFGEVLDRISSMYNLEWESIATNEAAVVGALNDGYIIWARGTWGLSTTLPGYIEYHGGHLTVTRATDGNGNVYVSDPASRDAHAARNKPVPLSSLVNGVAAKDSKGVVQSPAGYRKDYGLFAIRAKGL